MKPGGGLRPELCLGPNPFIEALPPPIRFEDLPATLMRSPLKDVPWKTLDAADRDSFLNLSQDHFTSTAHVIEAAAGVQQLLRRTLVMRNPVTNDERRRVNRVGLAENKAEMRLLPRLDGAGAVVAGMTGMGKTAVLRRILECIAPEQVIDYGMSEACGWYRLKQCVYLHIDHPSNGTRGGLLKRILEHLDYAIGTSYVDEHRRTSNLDSLMVVVSKLLTMHRVAVVVIDENQQTTLQDSPWRVEFALFHLMLMNLGISVVLAGNPLAFEYLQMFSQVVRRFSVGGIHRFQPASSVEEKWWQKHFVPQARGFSLVENWSIDSKRRAELEYENSAGNPGLFAAYHCEVQRVALRRGGPTATVTETDYLAAARSPHYIEVKQVALAIRMGSTPSQRHFLDLPAAEVFNTNTLGQGAPFSPPTLPSDASFSAAKRLLTNYATQETKKRNKLLGQLESLKNLDKEDVRALGITEDLLSEMMRVVSFDEKPSVRKKTDMGTKDDER